MSKCKNDRKHLYMIKNNINIVILKWKTDI